MEKLKIWLNTDEGTNQVPDKKLTLMINRLDTSEVSIKAFNLVPITYTAVLHVSEFHLRKVNLIKSSSNTHLCRLY